MNHDKSEKEVLQKVMLVHNKPSEIVVKTSMLSIVDVLLAIFVIAPLVLLSWRGYWGFMEYHPDYFPVIPCFLIGLSIHLALALSQDVLHTAIIEADKHWTLHIVSHFMRRFYTYIFLSGTILHWRSGWALIDRLTKIQYTENYTVKSEGSHWLLLLWTASFLALLTLKGLRNCVACPFAICIDKSDYVFKFPTTFWRQSYKNRLFSILDTIFSIVIMANIVMVFWRGLFALGDILILPNHFVWSAWMSTAFGLILIGLVFRLENCVKLLCSRYKGFRKIVIADCFVILSIIATIVYWRGLWAVINIYYIPSSPDFSFVTSHLIGFMGLVVLNCSSTSLVRGVVRDGKELNPGECVMFPCEYLRIILQEEDSAEPESDKRSEQLIKNNISV